MSKQATHKHLDRERQDGIGSDWWCEAVGCAANPPVWSQAVGELQPPPNTKPL